MSCRRSRARTGGMRREWPVCGFNVRAPEQGAQLNLGETARSAAADGGSPAVLLGIYSRRHRVPAAYRCQSQLRE